MTDGVIWWLTVELIGAAAFPIGFVFFRFLPDRGYSFTKALGLLLAGYALWLGATAHVIPNARWSIVLIFALLAATSVALALRGRWAVAEFLRERWRYVLVAEALFTGAFAVAAFIRSYAPDISSVEPMDLAFVGAITRSEYFPPRDPWLSGHAIPVHHFGHLYVALLVKLTAIPARIGLNLGLAMVFAMTMTSAFGLVYNLIAARDSGRRAVTFGLAAAALMVLLSNLEGFFEMLAAHGIGSTRFYDLVDVYGLDGPSSTGEWYPTDGFWIFRAVSFTYGGVDRQFPFFSFLVGDLHAHVMAMPLLLLTFALALNVWRSGWALSWRFLIDHPALSAVVALSIGALAFTNIWDGPTAFFVLVALVVARNYLVAGYLSRALVLDSLSFLLPVGLVSVLAFLPFHLGFSPDSNGIALVEAAHRGPLISLGQVITRPHHLLYMWLPFLTLAGALAWLMVRRSGWQADAAIRALAVAAIPLAVWFLVVLVNRGTGVADEISARGSNWITVLVLLGLLSGLLLALGRELGRGQDDRQPSIFPLVLAATGVLLLLGMELFWVDELSGARNFRFSTVFRLGYQAWILLSIGGAYALYRLTEGRAFSVPAGARFGLGVVTALALIGGLVYAPSAVFWKTDSFRNPTSLDALAATKRFKGSEYESFQWLWENVEGTPVIVEAVGSFYSPFGRVSVATGLPTVLGWPEHEGQWRGSLDPMAGRAEAVERIYATRDPEEARRLLEQFDAEYVYVGKLERESYGSDGVAKFSAFMTTVFQNEEVTIYKVREEGREIGGLPGLSRALSTLR